MWGGLGPKSQGMGAGAGKWASSAAMRVGAAPLALRGLKSLCALMWIYSPPQAWHICFLTLRNAAPKKHLCVQGPAVRPTETQWHGVSGLRLPTVPAHAL